MKPYYITTSRPYTNAAPHLGTVMDPIYADVYARFHKLQGESVFFSMGTDEHSTKIVDKALELGISTQDYVDSQFKIFETELGNLDILADEFMQNSSQKHKWLANLVWQKLQKQDLIYKHQYQGLYCIGCEDFYSQSQLINNRCPIHINIEIQKVEEENYFLRLSKFQNQIQSYLQTVVVNNPGIIGEMSNFCNDLQDISISRDRKRLKSDWGVIVENDPEHIMYVWFEALISYLTPLIPMELCENWLDANNDIQKTIELEVWEILQENLPQNLQVIGTDNSKFHLIIWAGILLGLKLEPIKSLIIHGMINDSEGRKFSKSLGNGVQLVDLEAKVGMEGIRFFVLNYCNSHSDTNFDWNKVIESYNSNLANNFGNLINRVTNLVEKYLDGEIDNTSDYKKEIDIDPTLIFAEFNNLRPELAFRAWFNELSKINIYLENTKPWMLAKDLELNANQIKEVLSNCVLAILELIPSLSLFLPASAANVYQILNSSQIQKSPILFQRIEIDPK